MQIWRGIMKIIDVQHLDINGNLIWQKKSIYNLLHLDGEEFLLRAAFTGGKVSTIIPTNYFLGLDNRLSLNVGHTMDDLIAEPSSSGYQRQAVSSSGDFVLNSENNHLVALSPIVAFQAAGGGWGPVSNLFLTDRNDNQGYLISSAPLGEAITVAAGESVTMRIGMTLKDCP